MIQIKVSVPLLLLKRLRRHQTVRGYDSDGFFAPSAGGLSKAASPRALVMANAGIPLLFRQHPAGKLPQRRDESIGF
ncbi:hypothetical protein HFO97_12580 [Rhizobium leguminosarum]|uniref:hypothetical protein n=1 Tax=Rhizobium leguminosarum TaxID=384 RepID=UPI001C9506B7|nr:hypothetical protein [Rhizobium leguminosarum]MBY5360785.1 hypothetical protein [Rhizobium leguminosarum]